MPWVFATTATLMFSGDDLDPDTITAALGISPSIARRKGNAFRNRAGVERTASTGSWQLAEDWRRPGDLDSQIAKLLAEGTRDLETWRSLTAQFDAEVYCGLQLNEWNEGMNVSPETMRTLGERGLRLGLEIYAEPEKIYASPEGE